MHYKLDYEKQVHSQHGEDGIIEQMTNAIKNPDLTFLELGWGDGGTNMTNYLQFDKGWTGIGVDAKENPKGANRFTDKFTHVNSFVYPQNANTFIKNIPYNPDFFSLDIDSYDYAVAHELFLNCGFRPKTVCVEFADAFGPNTIGSFPYVASMPFKTLRKGKLTTSGCSLKKWQLFFEKFNYTYFGFDTSGTNCFFYNPDECNTINLNILETTELSYTDDIEIKKHIRASVWNEHYDKIFSLDLGV